MPILKPDQIKAIRAKLGLSQEELAEQLGYTGSYRRQKVYRLEAGAEPVDYLRANLLRAMEAGYVPVGWQGLKAPPPHAAQPAARRGRK